MSSGCRLRWVWVSVLLALGACTEPDRFIIPRGSPDEGKDGGGDSPFPDGGDFENPTYDGGWWSPDADVDENTDGGDGSVAVCKTECEPDDCGELMDDGCGGTLNCKRTCEAGEICGLKRADKCDAPDPIVCESKSAAEVCANKCGLVSDGCSGTIECTADNGGVACGPAQLCGGYDGNRHDNACVDIPVPDCIPRTCESMGYKCGTASDGCGHVLDCALETGGCTGGTVCYFGDAADGKQPNTCIAPEVVCSPDTSAAVLCTGKCGTLVDSCGNPVNCNAESTADSCGVGETCGGGGTPNECGSGAAACTPTPSITACEGRCGFVSNGCPDGNGYLCDGTNGGQSCNANAGETCGGGGVTGQCGKPPCTPKTADELCAADSCAKGLADSCGGSVDCPACSDGMQCGIYMADTCSTPVPPACTPSVVTQACANKCGSIADGCGGVHNCSGSNGGVTCSNGEWCGGGGVANSCGKPACVKRTCGGNTCGEISDGCGGKLSCWQNGATSCGQAESCLVQNGVQQCVSGGPSCVGSLCSSLPAPTACSAGSPTKLTGTVRTPGYNNNGTYRNQLPVPNAIVYIPASPNLALPSIFEGVDASNPLSCGRCSDEKLVADGETVLAAAVTDYRGEFSLEGRIPVGVAFNLVIKIGKWRRVVQVPGNIVTQCQSQGLALQYTRLAANSSDGLTGTRLPKIAISTGNVDEMECVFRNMGISESEFTLPTAAGRIHMYRANGALVAGNCTGTYRQSFTTRNCADDNAAGCRNNKSGCSWTNPDSLLFNDYNRLNDYDMVVWDCEGSELFEAASPRANLETYVNAGGRMFASHYSYTWIENNGTLDQSADWGDSGSADTDTGFISMPSGTTARSGANGVKSVLFKNWLDWQGALVGTTANLLTNPLTPQFSIKDPRDRAGANVGPRTDEWAYRNQAAPKVQQLSFNTPYGSAEQNMCGRVAYSGFHVASADSNQDEYFPGVCSTGDLSAQEKILAFMLFDLGTCVSAGDPPVAPSCTPKTEAELCPTVDAACGYLADGCGGVVDCGGCSAGNYCDGSSCKPQQCTPATCESLGYNCGSHSDGCNGIARNAQGVEGCGTCSGNQVCGLGGTGLCGSATCTPISASTACAGKNCGQVSNGCGGTYNCGTCTDGQICGGGGANVCGPGSCTAISKDAACLNKDCGQVGDGCGGAHECGTCAAPASCGGGGQANKCGQPSCTPLTNAICASQDLECGFVSDGCSGTVNCGECANHSTCGSGGAPNTCGAACSPTTCTAQGAECGPIADACGGILQCGTCPVGQTCGGGGPNKCGTGVSCTPRSCNSVNAQCGTIGDGCGGVLDCGTCTAPATCGVVNGVPNRCGTNNGGCNKLTCASQNAACGPTSDGCGGVLDCGGCLSGYQCQANQCVELPPVLW